MLNLLLVNGIQLFLGLEFLSEISNCGFGKFKIIDMHVLTDQELFFLLQPIFN